MSLDPASARDLMASVLIAAWGLHPWASLGLQKPPTIEWQGMDGNKAPAVTEPYLIWAANHNQSPQAALSDDIGNRLYETSGMLIMQAKAPLIKGNGFEVAERMAIIARNAYRGKTTPDCIWFRNARFEEVGADAGWFLFNIFVEFEYDEVG